MVPLKAAFEQAEAELAEAKRRVADAELCAEEQRAYSCELEGDVEQARALLKVATCGRAGSLEFLQFEAARMAWLRLIDSEREKEG